MTSLTRNLLLVLPLALTNYACAILIEGNTLTIPPITKEDAKPTSPITATIMGDLHLRKDAEESQVVHDLMKTLRATQKVRGYKKLIVFVEKFAQYDGDPIKDFPESEFGRPSALYSLESFFEGEGKELNIKAHTIEMRAVAKTAYWGETLLYDRPDLWDTIIKMRFFENGPILQDMKVVDIGNDLASQYQIILKTAKDHPELLPANFETNNKKRLIELAEHFLNPIPASQNPELTVVELIQLDQAQAKAGHGCVRSLRGLVHGLRYLSYALFDLNLFMELRSAQHDCLVLTGDAHRQKVVEMLRASGIQPHTTIEFPESQMGWDPKSWSHIPPSVNPRPLNASEMAALLMCSTKTSGRDTCAQETQEPQKSPIRPQSQAVDK